MNKDELARLSNQTNYQRPPRLELNELSLNGESGKYRKRVLVGHSSKDGKPKVDDLGTSVKVTFLKIRRKLVERGGKGEIVRSTSEHNHVDDVVRLFTDRGEGQTAEREEGVARELREQYEGLRTVQIVYALLWGVSEPELVRLMVKGSSLGSEAKAKDVPSFYQYVQSFESEPMAAFVTNLGATVEEGARSYYTMTFARGAELSEDQLAVVERELTRVHEVTEKQDAFYRAPAPVIEEDQDVVPVGGRGVEYPEEELNPDDIPF